MTLASTQPRAGCQEHGQPNQANDQINTPQPFAARPEAVTTS